MKTILLIGKNGQVGWELQRALEPLGCVIALDRAQMGLRQPDVIRKTIRDAAPAIIVNAAGYTAVDKAEKEPDLAMQVNAIAPGVMAEEAKRLDALLVHYSTDYVFDGTRSTRANCIHSTWPTTATFIAEVSHRGRAVTRPFTRIGTESAQTGARSVGIVDREGGGKRPHPDGWGCAGSRPASHIAVAGRLSP